MLQELHAAGHNPTSIASKHQHQTPEREISTTQHSVAFPSRGSHQIIFHQQGISISSVQLNTSAWYSAGTNISRAQLSSTSLQSSSIRQKRIKQPRSATLEPISKAKWTARRRLSMSSDLRHQ
ncbi:hypothetical protein Nepgr_015816 [Nepenthes gracilis]|uniref:Uncharacterized protein n=1 Tax=Nepenthes gracilis TaxID=150966 RepID=A0AAD3SNJ0_NEPGR|nr:hypothetical protein Nepgr_015816 [Nepenthes gracilis]